MNLASHSPLVAASLAALMATARDPQRYKAAHALRGNDGRNRKRSRGSGYRAARKAKARGIALENHARIANGAIPPKHMHSDACRKWALSLPIAA